MSRLKELREQAGMTQERLAELSGVYQETIARIEKGRRRMGIEVAVKVAPVLKTDAADLLGLKNLAESIT